MGSINFGCPKLLVNQIIETFQLNIFIETGTFKGETALWASSLFKQVYTIENSQELYASTSRKYSHIQNIQFLYGDTRVKLSELLSGISEPAVIWLDAHWSGGNTYGQEVECPLIEEIEAINLCDFNHFILIDDARLFLSPPPPPHNPEQWKDIATVVSYLSKKERYIAIHDDVIIAVPVEAKQFLVDYLANNYKSYADQPTLFHITVQELYVIENFIQSGSVIFDVGANQGEWTKALLGLHPNCQVHLFEPNPTTYQKLIASFTANDNAKNIIYNPFALSSKAGMDELFIYKNKDTLNSMYRRTSAENDYGLVYSHSLPIFKNTLDNYCKTLGVHHIDFLKIDVEGAELDVLCGAEEMLSRGLIDCIQFEYGGTYLDAKITLSSVFNFLHANKYLIFYLGDEEIEYIPIFFDELENFQYANYLAIHERLSSIIFQEPASMINLQQEISNHKIIPKGVIHVGAHEGQEISEYLNMGISKMLLVEANPKVAQRLKNKLNQLTSQLSFDGLNCYVACCAVTDFDGTTELRITSNDQSSSLLEIKEHSAIYPEIIEIDKINVPAKKLDTLLLELGLNYSDFNILNIDVQGAELSVLHGAIQCLEYVQAINIEVNYRELYAGCCLIHEVDHFLESHGFYRALTVSPYHPSWGDALYIRKPVICMSDLGINGRFGNQLFQYAFLKICAKRYDLQVQTPNWVGQSIFNNIADPPIKIKLPLIKELPTVTQVSESIVLRSNLANVDISGYFQFHSSFFASEKEMFCQLYQPKPDILESVDLALCHLREQCKTLVGVHIRLGDFVYRPFQYAPIFWYREWLDGYWATLEHPLLLICSDEPEQVVSFFAGYNYVLSSDLDIVIDQAPYYLDFYLLSKCDILAISNSSFSFAAAMLNSNAKYFFRPHVPTQKLIPFDPWNSDIFTLENATDPPYPQSISSTNGLRKFQLSDFLLFPVSDLTTLLNQAESNPTDHPIFIANFKQVRRYLSDAILRCRNFDELADLMTNEVQSLHDTVCLSYLARLPLTPQELFLLETLTEICESEDDPRYGLVKAMYPDAL